MFKINKKYFLRKIRKVDTFFHNVLSTVLKSLYSENANATKKCKCSNFSFEIRRYLEKNNSTLLYRNRLQV